MILPFNEGGYKMIIIKKLLESLRRIYKILFKHLDDLDIKYFKKKGRDQSARRAAPLGNRRFP
jgi:hypothetical protein